MQIASEIPVTSSVLPFVEKKNEPYSISADGHIVGVDGFVVPKNFREFYEWEPLSVRRFLMKKLHRQQVDEEVIELEQDLLLHLHYLPEKSKYRKEGKTDVIQCFDPERQHGASAKRFHNYLAFCMSNRFCTILHKQKKNPLYNKMNLSIIPHSASSDDNSIFTGLQHGEVEAEFVYHHSIVRSNCDEGQSGDKAIFIAQFKAYVKSHAPKILPTLDAIAESSSFRDARLSLGLSTKVFDKQRETIDLLRDCFLRGEAFKSNKSAAKHRRSTRIRVNREAKRAERLEHCMQVGVA